MADKESWRLVQLMGQEPHLQDQWGNLCTSMGQGLYDFDPCGRAPMDTVSKQMLEELDRAALDHQHWEDFIAERPPEVA